MSEPTLIERINRLPQTDDKTDPHILRARKNHARSHIAWCEEEDQILASLLENNRSLSYICGQLKRSRGAIEARIKILGTVIQSPGEVTKNDETSTPPIDNNKSHPHQITENEIKRVLQYWGKSLADADQMGLPPEQMKQGEEFTLADLKSGQLCSQKTKRFFD